MKKISIIIPAYNEQESLPILYERLTKLMETLNNYDFEVLFVNDGSKDQTIEIIKELREKDKRICYVDFARNFGEENCNDSRTRLCNRRLCNIYGCRLTRSSRISTRIS